VCVLKNERVLAFTRKRVIFTRLRVDLIDHILRSARIFNTTRSIKELNGFDEENYLLRHSTKLPPTKGVYEH
jgi:hypothetical protein